MADKNKTEELLLEARNFVNSYKKEIGESVKEGKKIIYLNFHDIASFSHELAELILNKPEDHFSILETALEESGLIENPVVRLIKIPENYTEKVRNLRSRHLNKLIQVEGIVRQASEVRPQVINARFECPSCGTIISVLQIDKKFRKPRRCSCGRKGNFKLLNKDMVDAQRLVIEESPEALVGGEQPRRVNVFLKEDLVEPKMEKRTTPGSKIRVIGVLKEIPITGRSGSTLTRSDIAVEANNIIPLEETFEDLDIGEEDERQIKELSADPEILKKLIKSIAPSIYGYEQIKKALVLQLFGGVKKQRSDGTSARGDIHILLVGDPGVAKSIGENERILYHTKKEVGYKKIKDIFEKFGKNPENLNVLTINPKNHNPEWCKVKQTIKHKPEKELVKITTEHGKEITATKDHSFITLSDKGKIIPIKGEKLTKNNYLPIPADFHKKIIEEIDAEDFNTHKTNSKQLPKKIKLTRDFGFFMGIFLAEGCIKSGKTVHLSNKNKEIKEKIVNFAKKLSLPFSKNEREVSIFSKSLSNFIKSHCYNQERINNIKKKVKGRYTRIKRIPEFSYFAPKDFIKGIISGIFSGDGRFVKNNKRIKGFELITISKELAQGTSDLLFSIGILNKIKENSYPYNQNKTPYYTLSIPYQMIFQFKENFNFHKEYLKCPEPIYSYHNCIPCGNLVYSATKQLGYNKRNGGDRTFAAMMRTVKRRNKIGRIRLKKVVKKFEEHGRELEEIEKLKKILNSPIIWSKIEKIEKVKKQKEVYDLFIPKTNTFVANGLGVHNSVTLKYISKIAPKGRYLSGKSASLDYNEPLLIKKSGKQKFVKIGEFVDEHYKNKKEGFQPCKEDIKALSLNLKTKKLEWKKIRAVYRHKYYDNLLEFKLKTGRKIKVTKDHSLFCIEKGKIKNKPSEKLEVGDYLVIPKKIPTTDDQFSKDIAKFLGYFIAEGHLYNSKGSYKISFTLNKNEIEIASEINRISETYFGKPAKMKKRGKNSIRLTIYGKTPYIKMCSLLGSLAHKKAKKKGVPEIILNSNSEARESFFNSYIEGDYSVTKSKKLMSEIMYLNLQDEIISSCLERKTKNSRFVEDRKINSKGNRYDLQSPLPNKKFGSMRKNFPIKCLPKNLKRFFKNAISSGYSRINFNRIPKEKKMLIDMIITIFKKKEIKGKDLREKFGKNCLEYFNMHKDLFNREQAGREEKFFLTKKGKKTVKNLKRLLKLLESDVAFVKIQNIEKCLPTKKFVYDVSTPENENFVAGFGGIICHNTGAGITATVVRDEYLKGWSLEAGAMVLSNKGIVCIDELEKMGEEDRSTMHEALEQQTVTISKANVQATLRSETSVLAAGNPKFGRFDPYQTVASQIDLPPTLINRFDVIFILKDKPNQDKDTAIAEHVLKEHQKQDNQPPIEEELLKKYIAYSKQKASPVLTEETIKEIKDFYVNLRNAPVESEDANKPLPISARQLEGLIRLSEAHAKIRLSKKVEKKDAKVAIDLMKYYLMQVGYDYETKTFDIDRIATGISTSERGKIRLVKETLANLEQKLGKLIPVEEIKKVLEGKVDERKVDETLQKLSMSGDIFHPKKGFVQMM